MSVKFQSNHILILTLSLFLSAICWQCSTNKNIKYGALVNKPVDKEYVNNATIDSIIAPYKSEMDKKMNVVLNVADQNLEKGRPESKLGNLVCDLSINVANTYYKPTDAKPIDFCLLNNGGLRTTIPKGPITLGLVYQVMPFENELVVITLSSDKTRELFEYVAQKGGEPIANAKVGISDGHADNILINGEPIESGRNYKILTSDYLARGGDKMDFFLAPIASEKVGIKLRDAIIEYLEKTAIKNKTIDPKIEGRVYYD